MSWTDLQMSRLKEAGMRVPVPPIQPVRGDPADIGTTLLFLNGGATMTRFGATKTGFTLVELLIVIAIIGTLVGMLLPAVQSAREAARRSACGNNIRQLGLALLNFESSRRRLPAASDRGWNGGGGGYSWIAFVLPFMEETNLHNTLSSSSNRFSAAYVGGGVNAAQALVSLPQLICPSFSGNIRAATAYATTTVSNAAITNYKGTAAEGYSSAGMPDSGSGGGGVMTLQTWGSEPGNSKTGVTLSMISDGTSKTFALAETRETTQSAWIDGSRAWVTAATGQGVINATARTWTGTSSLLEQWKATPAWAGYGGTTPQLGPSSQHQGGIVVHGYADGHVGLVNSEIDTNLYFSLYTRGDGETVSETP